jgi:hypothetical protein
MLKFPTMLTRSGPLAIVLILLFILFNRFQASRLTTRVSTLEREKTQLVEFAERLSAARRVAQVNVLEQWKDEQGVTVTRLRWQEIGPDDRIGAPVEIEVLGEQVYFEAFVIKFEHRFVGRGDADRGTSVALFRRVFGDAQAPQSGRPLDQLQTVAIRDPVGPPSMNDRLWERFWEFVDNPVVASAFGVRVAQCEAPAVRLRAGQIWEVTLDAAGGVNLQLTQRSDKVARRSNGAP